MRDFLFFVFLFLVLYPFIQGLRDKSKIYELPFLYSISTLVFILPTLFFVKDISGVLTDDEYNRYLLNAILCLICSFLGYNSVSSIKSSSFRNRYLYKERSMYIVILPIFLLGVVGSSLIDPSTYGEETSGSFAIILLFARLLRPLAIVLVCLYLIKPDNKKLVLLLIWLVFVFQFVFISGRRSEVFALAITLGFPLFFIKNISLPKWALVPSLFLALFVVIALPIIREFTKAGEFNQIGKIDFSTAVEGYFLAEETNEIVESAINMQVVTIDGAYNYGASIYNALIFQYVSATLFGPELKQKLLISPEKTLADLRKEYASESSGGEYLYYLAHSGFASTYYEFGYFACIAYFLFGRLSKILFLKTNNGDLLNIVIYCVFSLFILMSIYDSITSIPPIIVQYLVVIYLIFAGNKVLYNNYG